MAQILGRPDIEPFLRVKTITTNYTVVRGDAGYLILVNTTGGAVTVSLPALSTVGDGFVVSIKRITAGANALTIDPNGAETIEGAATLSMATQYQSVNLVSWTTVGWLLGSTAVPLGRQVIAGSGLTGGGTLAGDVTLAVTGGSTPTIQVFTSNGTWTRPAGCTKIKVTCTGGGGGGGGADNDAAIGKGGGAGSTAISYVDVSALASAAVAIGTAGTAGSTTGGNGGAGGSSTFNTTTLVAGGGAGGGGVTGAGNNGQGGAGGTATAGDIRIRGGQGGPGVGSGSVGALTGGAGGVSYWGGGGGGNTSGANVAGEDGMAYGSGGAGGGTVTSTGKAGGAGAPGIVVVEEYY